MRTAMFPVKQWPNRGWRGSSRGLAGSSRGLDEPNSYQNAAKSRLAAALVLAISVGIAGCSSPEQIAEKTGVAATATGGGSAAASSTTAGPAAFEDNSTKNEAAREFAYSWPAQVSAIPELADRFTAERNMVLAEQKAEWQQAITDFAGEDCVACISRGYEKTWQVVTDLPGYLSLSADMYLYTGGAHGNSAFEALVWDRKADSAIAPEQMFRSEQALQTALYPAWCKALKAERITRLGTDYSEDAIFPCPDIAQLTMLLGSSNKQTFNRIGLIAAPYVAGSYAEGAYEVTLPVTPAMLAAVRPEYQPAFAIAK